MMSYPMPISITPIHAFQDNYIWLCQNKKTQSSFVVDPGDAKPVLDYLHTNHLRLCYILLTHHHHDHTGGVKELKKQTSAIVYGPKQSPFPLIDYTLEENDTIDLKEIPIKLSIMEIPGHTLDHIAYFNSELIFCGDTLFSGGCGRIFEGTPEQMYHSLEKIQNLPDSTQVYCAHEYTLSNLNFAKNIEPSNRNLLNYIEKIKILREQNQPSLPSSIGLEKSINPFLRCTEKEVITNAMNYDGQKLNTQIETFAAIRRWKDTF